MPNLVACAVLPALGLGVVSGKDEAPIDADAGEEGVVASRAPLRDDIHVRAVVPADMDRAADGLGVDRVVDADGLGQVDDLAVGVAVERGPLHRVAAAAEEVRALIGVLSDQISLFIPYPIVGSHLLSLPAGSFFSRSITT